MKRALLIVLFTLAACKKAPEGPLQLETEALTSAGFKADAMTPSDPKGFSAQKCTYGKLEGLEAVLCEYGSADAVAAGKKSAESWLGDAPTAVVLDHGLAVLTVVDRTRSDPNGKTMHKLTQAFLNAK